MRCSHAARQLQLYIDYRLPLEQMRQVEAHVATCEDCQEELRLLEEVAASLHTIRPVVEPPDLTTNIMRRVALSAQSKKEKTYQLLRPTFIELLLILLLATASTLVVIAAQPSLRGTLPFANTLPSFSLLLMNLLHVFVSLGSFGLWVVGTLLGVCITLVVAGNEMRSLWFKAMVERLPVW